MCAPDPPAPAASGSALSRVLTSPLIWTVRGYQRLISRYTPPVYRFTPSCSSYAIRALRVHGLVRGSVLAAWRILRCNPFFPGGYDPVPPADGSAPRATPTGAPPALGSAPDSHPSAPDAGPCSCGPHGEGDPS